MSRQLSIYVQFFYGFTFIRDNNVPRINCVMGRDALRDGLSARRLARFATGMGRPSRPQSKSVRSFTPRF